MALPDFPMQLRAYADVPLLVLLPEKRLFPKLILLAV